MALAVQKGSRRYRLYLCHISSKGKLLQVPGSDVNITFGVGDDDGYMLDDGFGSKTYRRYMDLDLLECYESNPLLSYEMLLMNGLNGTIRSQRRVTPGLEEYLASITAG